MSSFRVPIRSTGAIEEAFSRMPANVKEFVREGFRVLPRVSYSDPDELLKPVLEAVHNGPAGFIDSPLSERWGLTHDETVTLFGALSFAASLFSTRQESAEQFVETAVNLKIIDASARDSALKFLQAVASNKVAFTRVIAQSRLANEVLPSLLSISTAVDVRLGFEKGLVTNSVPIAVVHIDTDAGGKGFWFQMSKSQVEKTIKDLEEALRKLDQAEKWANQNRE